MIDTREVREKFDEVLRFSSQEGDVIGEKSGATIDISLLLLLCIHAA